MNDAADVDDRENWTGGFYELSIELGPADDVRLELALRAVWKHAAAVGCFAPHGEIEVPLSLASLEEHGHLRGVVRLPSGAKIVCGAVASKLEGRSDWLDFYIPLGALARVDRRVGGFPFDYSIAGQTLAWRLPLDRWLAQVGMGVFEAVPFEFARIGFESSGYAYPSEEYFGRLVVTDGRMGYLEAEK